MKANNYKSGNIATLIGASHEALRFYHNNEIFIPRKKRESKYNIYSDHDLASLYNLRSYKTFGLSIKESGESIKKQDFYSVSDNLEKARNKIEQSNQWNQLMLFHIKRIEDYIKRLENSTFEIIEIEFPEMYTFSLDKQNKLSDIESSILKELATLTPVIMPIYTIPASYLKNTFSSANAIFAILEQDIGYFKKYYDIQPLIDKGIISKLNINRCLNTIIKITIETTYDPNTSEHIIKYLNEHNLTVTDNLIGNIIAVNYKLKTSDIAYDYYNIWIPIK